MSTTRKIRCTDCGETVPIGRLSCPACGTLLASVTGGLRQAPAATAAADGPSATSAPTLQPRPLRRTTPKPASAKAEPSTTLTPTSVIRSVTAGGLTPATAGVMTSGTMWTPPVVGAWNPPTPDAATIPADTPAGPVSTAASVAPTTSRPRLPRALPMRWDRQRLEAGLEWSTALGSGLMVIAMIAPWSRTVIGSQGATGYFGSWGLAGPMHVLVLLGALITLVLAVLPNKVPIWITRGLAPLMLGVFALGLAWPYAMGPLGGQIGVVIAMVGSIVLIVTGVLAVWQTRHGVDEPAV